MNARRMALLTSVVLMMFIPIALAQPPAPAAAPTTPAPARVQTPRATARPPATPAPVATPEQPDQPPQAAPVAQATTVPPQAPKVVAPAIRAVKTRPLTAVKIEFTITDQLGSRAPTKKTMAMTIGAGEFSRIRTSVRYARKDGNSYSFQDAPLSIDARPDVDGNKIALDFTLEYKLLDEPGADGLPAGSTTVSERLYAVLESGVPSIIAQSADAMSDRKVTIEVKATIVK